MTPVDLFFILTMFFADGHIEHYDAKFKTLEECVRMGDMYFDTGMKGPMEFYRCTLTYDS
jgi:hypothetical protein